jgi:D-alanyl-D-alanine dipeptidase
MADMSLMTIPPHAGLIVDLRYATADNITGRPIYARSLALLHQTAAAALERALVLATARGLGLRLFDAYRPPEAQARLWQALPDPRFVADPRLGSPHGRGVAVDLTLTTADMDLDMGTGFDTMTPFSRHDCEDLPMPALRNRSLLAGIMAVAGWESYAEEWWHYQLPDATSYPLLADGRCGPALMNPDP